MVDQVFSANAILFFQCPMLANIFFDRCDRSYFEERSLFSMSAIACAKANENAKVFDTFKFFHFMIDQ